MKRPRQTIRARAAQRLAELYRYATFANELGARLDTEQWAYVLAATLAAAPAGIVLLPGSQRSIRWHGLDLISLKSSLGACGLGSHLTDEQFGETMRRVSAWQSRNGEHLIGARKLGHLIGLTAAERQECGIVTIDACDETKAGRGKRLAEQRRENNRKAKQASRAGRHRPLAECRKDVDRRREFCREHKITDRTLRRWISSGRVDVRTMSAISASHETLPPELKCPDRVSTRYIDNTITQSDTRRTPVERASSDTVQLSLLPIGDDEHLRSILDQWTAGTVPRAVRDAYRQLKRRRAQRQLDVANAIGLRREQLANSMSRSARFGLSAEATARFKHWALPDHYPAPPADTADAEPKAVRPHHRRGGPRSPDPGPALPQLRLFSIVATQPPMPAFAAHPHWRIAA